MITLEETRNLMCRAMEGVNDLSGLPISEHCLRVEQSCPPWFSDKSRQVAILHDTIEDTNIRLYDLSVRGFSPWVVAQLNHISQRTKEDYETYLYRLILFGHADTILIKLLDNQDNTLPWRMVTLSEKHRDYLTRRYKGVYDRLFDVWIHKRKG